MYWLTALGMLLVGFVTGFSIGPFVTLVALAMLALGPFRDRPQIYWPPMAAVLGFLIGYLAVAPWTCEAHGDSAGATSMSCTSLLGVIGYSGTGTYNPSHIPGVVAGLMLAAVGAVAIAAALQWSVQRRRMGGR